jgi:hypothetical protein
MFHSNPQELKNEFLKIFKRIGSWFLIGGGITGIKIFEKK